MKTLKPLIAARYRPEEYPALAEQSARWEAEKPLESLSLLDATPVFRNTLSKYIPLLKAGARLTVGLAEDFPHDPAVAALLQEHGIPVLRSNENTREKFDLVLDCAAAFAHLEPRIGYVELTRSGIEYYQGKEKPVFVADSGAIKRIETCLGTGESYFRAMEMLGYSDWKSRPLIVFGSGKVGTGLVLYAARKGARITVVTDPACVSGQIAKAVEKIIDYRDREAVSQAIREAYAVVTATGVANALAGVSDALNRSEALLANMGVEDEFGKEVPEERVLGRKRPLNFLLEEPTHLKYIEATMALHNEGAVWLAAHPGASGLNNPPAEIESRLLEITRRRGTIADEIGLIL